MSDKEKEEEEKKAPKAEDAPKDEAKEKKAPDKEVESLKKELSDLKKAVDTIATERDDWKNKYYTAYADMSNLRKDVQKETAEFKRYAKQSVIEEFIPVLDSFDMALKNEPDDPKLKKYLEGFQMIHKKLLGTLTQLDVTIIDPQKGDEFDPHLMEAYSAIDGEEDNKVAETFLKGYRMHDHLLRAAGVVITKKKEEKIVEKVEEKDSKTEEKKPESETEVESTTSEEAK